MSYGAGHIALLRQYIQQSGALQDVDPMPLLINAQTSLRESNQAK